MLDTFVMLWAIGLTVLSRSICGNWLNHLSLYTFVYGESPSLEVLSDYVSVAPVLYFYITGPLAGLDSYLSHSREPEFFGRLTLAPIYRLLDKFGANSYVPYYDTFYPTAVEDINTCTYLRAVYADYGGVGIIIFPWLLGALMTYWYLRGTHVAALAHLFVFVTFSFNASVMVATPWWISLALSEAIFFRYSIIRRLPQRI